VQPEREGEVAKPVAAAKKPATIPVSRLESVEVLNAGTLASILPVLVEAGREMLAA
jgi:hypothetical protein